LLKNKNLKKDKKISILFKKKLKKFNPINIKMNFHEEEKKVKSRFRSKSFTKIDSTPKNKIKYNQNSEKLFSKIKNW
jgi:hypothetical protein